MNKEQFEEITRRIINDLPPPEEQEESYNPNKSVANLPDLDDMDTTLIEVMNNNIHDVDLQEKEVDPLDVEIAIMSTGIECLGFYKSKHFINMKPYRGKWGIFIFNYGLKYIQTELKDYYQQKYSDNEYKEKAYNFIYYHERFHFRVDAWTILSLESVTKEPNYVDYMYKNYKRYHPNEIVVEETLANLHALSSLRKDGITKYAKEFMLLQPGAYQNIINIDRDELLSRLATQILIREDIHVEHLKGSWSDHKEHTPFIANLRNSKKFDSFCPVHLIKHANPSKIFPKFPLPDFAEGKRFVKKYLSGEELRRTDHQYYKIDNGETIKFPNQHGGVGQLKKTEIKGICHKAGVKYPRDYMNERKRTKVWKQYVPRQLKYSQDDNG